MIRIQLGKIFMNKTKTYLAPCLKEYGETFVDKLNSVFKVAVGIGDMILVKSQIHYERHMFILIDIKSAVNHFNDFIKWIKDQDMYEDDYAYDSVNGGRYHMIVVKLPESCYKPAELLKKSQFSKMYTPAQIVKYFSDRPKEKAILVKDHEYRLKYAATLNSVFGTTVKPEEIEGEYDFPTRLENEIFQLQSTKGS